MIVGIDKAGKTTLLEKLKPTYSALPGLEPDKILPTVGLNVGRVEAHNSLLVFWDLGGQAGLRPIWDKYYSDSHGLIFTVDSSEPARFAEAKDALERALGSRDLFGAPILVLANKQVCCSHALVIWLRKLTCKIHAACSEPHAELQCII